MFKLTGSEPFPALHNWHMSDPCEEDVELNFLSNFFAKVSTRGIIFQKEHHLFRTIEDKDSNLSQMLTL